ncbi:hypothetical protein M3Y99_00068900 [Aphelenchoides fujianensis]|nr:hypothetical protein M3Y99_00068900 [Aphelenchoides fujianensis]
MNSWISTLLLPLGPIVFLLLPLIASAAPRIVDSAALAFHRNAFRPTVRLADPPAVHLAPNGPPVHSPSIRVVTPVYSTAQLASSPPAPPSSSSATGDPIRVVLDRLLQHDGPIARSFARMFAAAQTPEQADPIASNPKELIAQPKHALNDVPAQPPGGDIEWKSILLGPKGILTSVFNEFKNKKLQEREKAKELQQQQPEAKSGNFDEPLPELPFIGICNRLSCGDIYKAVDEFRKSDAFGNLQTALSLLSDEKGLR